MRIIHRLNHFSFVLCCTLLQSYISHCVSEYRLPLGLQIGDKIEILSTGAYTASYASVGFNGFSLIRTYCI